MAEFDPRQLDQLEDALESLDDLDSLELSPELGDRLGEYQDVLALCRDAFPIEEPSDALLAEVIAEAHEVTRRTRPTPEPGRWRGFWERWRGTLIPGVALAGTAAAILLLLEPDTTIDQADELVRSDDSSEEAKREPREDRPSKPASEPTIEAKPKLDDADTNPVPSAGGGAGEPAIEADKPGPTKKKSKHTSPVIEPEPVPAPEPLSKEDTWSRLAEADAARRQGRCGEARQLYASVDGATTDTNALARAKAGIGLCLEQAEDDQASAWLSKARSTSPNVDSWIERERDEQPQPGEFDTKQSPAKKSAPSKKKSGNKSKSSGL